MEMKREERPFFQLLCSCQQGKNNPVRKGMELNARWLRVWGSSRKNSSQGDWTVKSILQTAVRVQFQAFLQVGETLPLITAESCLSAKVFLHRFPAIRDCQTPRCRQAELNSGTYGQFQQISKTGRYSSLTCNFTSESSRWAVLLNEQKPDPKV